MIVEEYVANINKTYQQGNVTEHSYRGVLQELLATLLLSHNITNEPVRIDCGAPDYIITNKNTGLPVASIEAKNIGDPDLEGLKGNREQSTRYKEAIEHIVFTDYLDFHFYRGGEFVASVRIGEESGGKIVGLKDNYDRFTEQIYARIAIAQPEGITSAKFLATMMAGKAKLLGETIRPMVVARKMEYTNPTINPKLQSLYDEIQKELLPDLTPSKFADIYSQTLTYGFWPRG